MIDGHMKVRGDLIHWAREQKGWSMRQVHSLKGPCPAFQSEVERGIKPEVSRKMLIRWATLLGVTPRFLCGEVPRYADSPELCAGLARGVAPKLRQEVTGGLATERIAKALRLISLHSEHLPPLVLAWCLNLELRTLDAIIAGEVKPTIHLARAVAALCSLDLDSLLTGGSTAYQQVMESARQQGVSPQALVELLEYKDLLPALRRIRRAGKGLDDLARWLNAEN